MRNCCKSCRLRRCQEAGMQRHGNFDHLTKHNIVSDIPILSSSTTNDSLPNVVHSSIPPRDLSASLPVGPRPISPAINFHFKASPKSLEHYPILLRLVCGYEHFIDAQQSLFSVEYPTASSEGHFIETNKSENLRLEKASIPLLYTMFNEYCDPMGYIPREEKAWEGIQVFNWYIFIGPHHRKLLATNRNASSRLFDSPGLSRSRWSKDCNIHS